MTRVLRHQSNKKIYFILIRAPQLWVGLPQHVLGHTGSISCLDSGCQFVYPRLFYSATLKDSLEVMFIYHLPSVQIFCWSVSVNKRMEKHVPFCIELKRETFENIHALLTSYKTYDSDDTGKTLTMSTLKLLKLQVGVSFRVFQSIIQYWDTSQLSISIQFNSEKLLSRS